MTRQDLIDILKMDNVLDELENAVQEKDLTQEEQDRIFDFLRSESREESMRIFEEILADIDSKEVYSDLIEELKDWREERRELANDIRELKNRNLDTKDEILKVQDEISNAHGFIRPVDLKPLEEKLNSEYSRLDVETKQLSALSLMHANARTMEAQIRGQIFKETTEPLRSSLKHNWDNLKGYTKESLTHVKNARDARHRTSGLSKHPVRDFDNRIRAAAASYHAKNANRYAQKIDKVQQKILDKANKIDQTRFKKEQFVNKLKAWSNGQPYQKVQREEIKDVNKAKDIIKGTNRYNDAQLKSWQKTLDKLNKEYSHNMDGCKHHLDLIAKDLRDRREEIQKEAKEIARQLENGELGKATYTMGVVEKNLDKAFESTFMYKESFSKDVINYMNAHGYEDLLRGYTGPEISENLDMNEQKIDSPEQIFDNEKHDAFIINEDGQVQIATPEEVQEILEQNQEQPVIEEEEIALESFDINEDIVIDPAELEQEDLNPTNLFNDEIEEQEQAPERE